MKMSDKEDVRQVRSQAAKVTYWGGGGSAFEWGGTGTLTSAGDGSTALHVLNRSPDPVPYANIAIKITDKNTQNDIQSKIWVISLRSIPPCTHIEYQDADLTLGSIQAEGEEPPTLANLEGIWEPTSMHFTDTKGVKWLRTESSLNKGEAPKFFHEASASRMGVVGIDAKVSKVESCKDA